MADFDGSSSVTNSTSMQENIDWSELLSRVKFAAGGLLIILYVMIINPRLTMRRDEETNNLPIPLSKEQLLDEAISAGIKEQTSQSNYNQQLNTYVNSLSRFKELESTIEYFSSQNSNELLQNNLNSNTAQFQQLQTQQTKLATDYEKYLKNYYYPKAKALFTTPLENQLAVAEQSALNAEVWAHSFLGIVADFFLDYVINPLLSLSQPRTQWQPFPTYKSYALQQRALITPIALELERFSKKIVNFKDSYQINITAAEQTEGVNPIRGEEFTAAITDENNEQITIALKINLDYLSSSKTNAPLNIVLSSMKSIVTQYKANEINITSIQQKIESLNQELLNPYPSNEQLELASTELEKNEWAFELMEMALNTLEESVQSTQKEAQSALSKLLAQIPADEQKTTIKMVNVAIQKALPPTDFGLRDVSTNRYSFHCEQRDSIPERAELTFEDDSNLPKFLFNSLS